MDIIKSIPQNDESLIVMVGMTLEELRKLKREIKDGTFKILDRARAGRAGGRSSADKKKGARSSESRHYCPGCARSTKGELWPRETRVLRCTECGDPYPCLVSITPEQLTVIKMLQEEIARLRAGNLDYLSGDLNELKKTVGFNNFNIFLQIDIEDLNRV